MIILTYPIDWIFNQNKKTYIRIFYALLILSIALTVYANLLPNYYTISDRELDVVKYLNKKIENENVIVITQTGSMPMIRQFGNFSAIDFTREKERINNFFNANNSYAAYKIALYYINYADMININIIEDRNTLISKLQKNTPVVEELISNELLHLNEILLKRELFNEKFSENNKPIKIYVVYSKIKGRSSNIRSKKWINENFINSDISKFDDSAYFEKVFSNNDIIVWKVKK